MKMISVSHYKCDVTGAQLRRHCIRHLLSLPKVLLAPGAHEAFRQQRVASKGLSYNQKMRKSRYLQQRAQEAMEKFDAFSQKP